MSLASEPVHPNFFPLGGPISSNFARYRSEGNFEGLRKRESWKEVKVMQAGQLSIATPNVRQMNPSSMTGRIADWMARVFGCWHMEMSRPFSHQGQAYRVCVDCGAHRKFNLGNWEMQGDFYYQRASTSQFYRLTDLAAVRRSV